MVIKSRDIRTHEEALFFPSLQKKVPLRSSQHFRAGSPKQEKPFKVAHDSAMEELGLHYKVKTLRLPR